MCKREDDSNGVNCIECGIAGEENSIWRCCKYNCTVEETTKMTRDICPYFIRRIYEDGAPLTPQQHLLISEQELLSRHMKGPV